MIPSASDRKADPFHTYQETYNNLKQWYDADYPLLDEECQEMDRTKGNWHRFAKQLAIPGTLRDITAEKGRTLTLDVETRLKKMEDAKQRAWALLQGMEEGIKFAKPFHAYVIQAKPEGVDVKQMESEIRDMDRKAKFVRILYCYLHDRIPKARFEGDAVRDYLVKGEPDLLARHMNYWSGRDSYAERVPESEFGLDFDADAISLKQDDLEGFVLADPAQL